MFLTFFIKKNLDFLRRIKFLYKNRKWAERKIHLGSDYKDKVFFVCRRFTPYNGIGSHIIVFLGMLDYKQRKYPDAIPLIDMKNYKQEIAETTENAWELFFEQPNNCGVNLNTINNAKNVILSNGYYTEPNPYNLPEYFTYEELKEKGWADLFNRFFRLQPLLKQKFDIKVNELFNGSKKILGVKIRGTDYAKLTPSGHSIQPTSTQTINIVKDFLKNHSDYTNIFLATEDKSIYLDFEKEFQEQLIVASDKFIDYHGGIITYNYNDSSISKTEMTTEYLLELYCLSKCNSFVFGKNSGVITTLLFNAGRFENTISIDLGKY